MLLGLLKGDRQTEQGRWEHLANGTIPQMEVCLFWVQWEGQRGPVVH